MIKRFFWRRFVEEVEKDWLPVVVEDGALPAEEQVVVVKSAGKYVGLDTVSDYTCRPQKFANISLYDWIRRSEKAKKKGSRNAYKDGEWGLDHIVTHKWHGQRVKFLIQWKAGDQNWGTYTDLAHCEVMDKYFKKLNVQHWKELPKVNTKLIQIEEEILSENESEDESVIEHDLDSISMQEGQRIRLDDDDDDGIYYPDVKNQTSESTSKDEKTLPEDAQDSWSDFHPDHPQYETHHVQLLPEKDSFVPDFIGPPLPRKDSGNYDEYCMTMLTFFKPWRTGKDLKNLDSNWYETFQAHEFSKRQQELMKFFCVRYECNDARDDYSAHRNGLPSGLPISNDGSDEIDDKDYVNEYAADGYGHSPWDEDAIAQDSHSLRIQANMREAERMMHTSGAMDQLDHDAIRTDYSVLQLANPNERSSKEWSIELKSQRDAILKQRETAAHLRMVEVNQNRNNNLNSVANVVTIIDQSYLTKDFTPPDQATEDLVEQTVKEFCLNADQCRAFKIVAHHACKPSGEQLKMYLGGMAGTGKSQVIKALTYFFRERHEDYRFMCMGPTGTASALIGGSTYHSVLNIRGGSSPSILAQVRENLKNVDYIFLDEVSMVDCKLFYSISEKMATALQKEGEPFGGVNFIVAGDFAQLPPISTGSPLYSHKVQSVIHTTFAANEQHACIGKALWHQFTTAVILKENMRQKSSSLDDIKFRTALENLRYKACTQADISCFESRVVGRAKDRVKLTDPNFRNVSIVTTLNNHRDRINELAAQRFASESGQTLTTFYSQDRYTSQLSKMKKNDGRHKREHTTIDPQRTNNVISPTLQKWLWELDHYSSSNHPGKLSICIGLPVMIKKNIATECGITNGAEGRVVGWTSKPLDATHAMLDILFVELTSLPKPLQLPGLPLNVVPIVHCSEEITIIKPEGISVFEQNKTNKNKNKK